MGVAGTGVAGAGTAGWVGARRMRATAWLTLRGLTERGLRPGWGGWAGGVCSRVAQVTRPQPTAAGGEA
jgi:hypothetical protein